MAISEGLKVKIYLHELSAWRIANKADMASTLLSKWVNGERVPREDDKRLIKVAKIVGYEGKLLE